MKRLDLKGYIVSDDDKWLYDLMEIGAVSHKDIKNFLTDADGDDVELFIDSPGGLVRVGSDIYSELRTYKGKSTAYIIGISASASTVCMLGANRVIAMPTARVMIHNAMTEAAGDYRDMEQAAIRLKSANDSIINAYEIKTGMSRADLQALMDKETWMTAQEAKGYGFIDDIALKEGESLSEIAASLPLPFAAPQLINMKNIHELAVKLKQEEEEEPKNENGEETQPASDTQKEHFYGLRKKLNR